MEHYLDRQQFMKVCKERGYTRIHCFERPTPLQYLKNISAHFGGPKLYIKREDLTDVALGGNKVRKLEYAIADALKQGADTIITQGAVQSNHVRQTIGVANQFGLETHAILERRTPNFQENLEETGNVFLDMILGLQSITFVNKGDDANAAMEKLAEELRAKGKKPYIVPGGATNAIGGLGYVEFSYDLLNHCEQLQIHPTHIMLCSGTGGCHAGIATGLALQGKQHGITLIGVSNNRSVAKQQPKVYKEIQGIFSLLGLPCGYTESDVLVEDQHIGEGFGYVTDEMMETVTLVARKEGLLLDPVYTGKAFAGIIDYIRSGRLTADDTVIFVHTGGTPALFAYEKMFREYWARSGTRIAELKNSKLM